MALNIKNPEVEKLATEVAHLARETKTEAIRKALFERRSRLQVAAGRPGRKAQLLAFLERSVWPKIPPDVLGHRLSRKEEDAILGYGPEGY
ncbi:MAG: type II toxin-antitoxin system VapB family antitoxin [Acidobacteria bacterium]|nr:type II toxin-antitoxin system VapB family antitoxin [Acidobacteriota bacterium]